MLKRGVASYQGLVLLDRSNSWALSGALAVEVLVPFKYPTAASDEFLTNVASLRPAPVW